MTTIYYSCRSSYYVLRSFKLLRATMDKTNSCSLLFVVFLTSLCNSQDYRYDDYNYNEYDYNNQQPILTMVQSKIKLIKIVVLAIAGMVGMAIQ